MANLMQSKLKHGAEMKHALAERIAELGQLPKNWDHYGAPAIDRGILAAAREFVQLLPDDLPMGPQVTPMSPGNLQFEWHRGSKVLELEFEDAATIRYLRWHPEQAIEDEDTFPATDVARAVELIQWFLNGSAQ